MEIALSTLAIIDMKRWIIVTLNLISVAHVYSKFDVILHEMPDKISNLINPEHSRLGLHIPNYALSLHQAAQARVEFCCQ